MDCSTPGLPVHHQLLEFTQTHVYWVSDAIQPSHPLSSSSPPDLNLSHHRGLFKWVSSSHQVAKVLEGFKMTFKFLDWVSKWGRWLDWLGVPPQWGCRKEEPVSGTVWITCTCGVVRTGLTLGHPVEAPSRLLERKAWMSVHAHTPVQTHGWVCGLDTCHISSQCLTEKRCCRTRTLHILKILNKSMGICWENVWILSPKKETKVLWSK